MTDPTMTWSEYLAEVPPVERLLPHPPQVVPLKGFWATRSALVDPPDVARAKNRLVRNLVDNLALASPLPRATK